MRHPYLQAIGAVAAVIAATIVFATPHADAQAKCEIIKASGWATDNELGEHLAREKIREAAKQQKAKITKFSKAQCVPSILVWKTCTVEARVCK